MATSSTNSFSRSVWWAVRPLWVWRLVRLLFRSLWVAALLALGGGLLAYATGRPLAWLDLAAVGSVAFVALFVFLSFWPVSARTLTRRLDQHFEFQDQLMAAYEVAGRGGAQNYIETDLLDAAHSSLREVRRRLIRRLPLPWTDLELAAVVATAAVAAYYWAAALALPPAPVVAHAGFVPLPAPGTEPMVQLPGVPAELQPSLASQIATGMDPGEAATINSAAGAQEVLDELAEALRSQTFTEAAGEALSQGAIEQAAEELRELAQNADALSDEARRDLAESLMAAAEALQDSAPEQAERLREMAESLLENTSNSAALNAATADALEGLAQMIEGADGERGNAGDQAGEAAVDMGGGGGEETGGQSGQGGSGEAEPSDTEGAPGDEAGAGSAGQVGVEESSTGSVESLTAQGVAVPLPDSQSLDSGSLRPRYDPSQAYQYRSVPYVHVGASGEGGEQAADPLSIPWRLRNVIQRYFSPP